MRKFLVACAGVGAMLGGNLSCGGNPVEAQQGPPGPQGPPGTNGVSGYEVVVTTQSLPVNVSLLISVQCPTNKTAISGGWSSHGSRINVLFNQPGTIQGQIPTTTNRNQWTFKVENNGTIDGNVDLYAVCVIAS